MKPKRLIIIGGGGHVKILIDAIRSTGLYRIEGILDSNLKKGMKILGVPVLGTDSFLSRHKTDRNKFLLAMGIGSVAATDKRKIVYEKFTQAGFRFPLIIHARAYVPKGTRCGDGTQVMANVVMHPDVTIGENVIINTGAIISHDCDIASHSHISLNAVLGGGVAIGERSHIGIGAKVLQGIRIGKRVTVGAGAVVINNVKDGETVVGIPAKNIK
jgi:UDP-perosamine 4-acetyltransferase